MIKLFFDLFQVFFSSLFSSRKQLISIIIILRKEIEILKRNLEIKNIHISFNRDDRISLSFISSFFSKARQFISLVKPETILSWYKKLVKKRWTFPHKSKKRGRPSVSIATKNMILQMKNENLFMGAGKIQGELKKLGIDLSKTTIRRIIAGFRKQGKIKCSLSWKKFISSHLSSLFAMDFLTVESLFGKRFYVFFLLYLKTREIVSFGVTDVPSRRFVRNQLVGYFEDTSTMKPYLIHDRSGEFLYQNYESLGIKSVPISVRAPNMNAFAERFVGSIRREALDWFIIVSYRQLYSIIKKYISYYNSKRPHQGIEQNIPKGYEPQKEGMVVSEPVCFGLFRHYFRKAA
jgi:hypothetical protein